MSNVYRSESSLSVAFDDLLAMILALERAWTCPRERAGLRHAAGDVRHHLCAVIADLDERARELHPLHPHSRFEILGAGTRVLAHEAFLSVLSLGQLLRRAAEDGLAAVREVAAAQLAAAAMLDELTPYISRADDALRRVLFDHEPLEVAVARIGRAG